MVLEKKKCMKIKFKKTVKEDSIFNEGFTINLNKKILKSKKGKESRPIFFEKIGNKNTSRDERKKNLIQILQANGFKLKK